MKTLIRPPKLADRFFEWYCRRANVEDLHGDAEELFYLDIQSMSARKARLRYWQRIISLTISYAVKSRTTKAAFHPLSLNSFNPAMLKNYFLIASRTLAKHKLFTAINVFGLAVGMSISLLFIAMLSFLLTYDDFHVNKDRVYRVITTTDDKIRRSEYASAPRPLGEMLKNDCPGIEKVTRIDATFSPKAKYLLKEINLNGYFVDKNFFQVFSFPLAKGNVATILDKPNTVVLTEKAALKMFGNSDVIGKVFETEDFGSFEITGLLKNIPKNSHMQFEVLTSYETLLGLQRRLGDSEAKSAWREFRDSYIYLLVTEAGQATSIENFLGKVSSDVYKTEKDFVASFELQRLADIAPGIELYNQIGPEWGYASLSVFMILTVLILLPACFNYANISISRALKRMKEIGLRKVMGGERNQIFFQFITETVIITVIALGFSYLIFDIIRIEFVSLVIGGSDTLDLSPNVPTIIGFIGFGLLVGFISGVVPALHFARLAPVQALKAKATHERRRFTLRKTLIVSQFALSLGFIMGVVIILNQYRQTLRYDFGFQQANLLDVELQDADAERFRTEFSKLSPVQSISMSSHIIGTQQPDVEWLKEPLKNDSTGASFVFVDENYLSNLGLALIAGKDFSEDRSMNKKYVIVNEQFLKSFRLKDAHSAIGETFILADGSPVIIRGVVRNFHYSSLREPIAAFFFRYDPAQFRFANLKVVSTLPFQDLSDMEAAWKSLGTESKFRAQYFDDEIKDAYSFYFSMVKICGFLGLLAITISCLGLLGMVVFTVENRVKEVGIRKVLGATSGSLTVLLSKDFLKLLMVAAMIAIPVTYLFFDKFYLRTSYYSMPIGLTEVVVSLAIILFLGLATILSQTLKAARTNPVDTLRSE